MRGELEPVVDIGDAGGRTEGSKNGFLVFVGDDEKGFDLPIVANFCPELKGFSSVVVVVEDETTVAAAATVEFIRLLTKGLVDLIVVAG